MRLATMFAQEDFHPIDASLDAWSTKHGVCFDTESKGYSVRSLWIDAKLQLWVDAPDSERYIRVHLAELKSELPSRWGRAIAWRTPANDLVDCLDQIWEIQKTWQEA